MFAIVGNAVLVCDLSNPLPAFCDLYEPDRRRDYRCWSRPVFNTIGERERRSRGAPDDGDSIVVDALAIEFEDRRCCSGHARPFGQFAPVSPSEPHSRARGR